MAPVESRFKLIFKSGVLLFNLHAPSGFFLSLMCFLCFQVSL